MAKKKLKAVPWKVTTDEEIGNLIDGLRSGPFTDRAGKCYGKLVGIIKKGDMGPVERLMSVLMSGKEKEPTWIYAANILGECADVLPSTHRVGDYRERALDATLYLFGRPFLLRATSSLDDYLLDAIVSLAGVVGDVKKDYGPAQAAINRQELALKTMRGVLAKGTGGYGHTGMSKDMKSLILSSIRAWESGIERAISKVEDNMRTTKAAIEAAQTRGRVDAAQRRWGGGMKR